MTPVAPRIVNDVSYVTDITHEGHLAWQVHHLVTLRIVNDVSRFIYVMRINHESHFAWQAQHLVTLVLRALQMTTL